MNSKELLKKYNRELRTAKDLFRVVKREKAALSAGAAVAIGEILGERYYTKAMNLV